MRYASFFRGLALSALLAVLALAGSARAAIDPNMPDRMTGYAWSSNVGWIYFGDFQKAYPKVSVDQATGVLSGYGWSPNIGWLVFRPDLSGPAGKGDNVSARIASSGGTYSMKGWFRACSIYTTGCPSITPLPGGSFLKPQEKPLSGTERGGWDGWIKLNNATFDPATKVYDGFAWGDLVVGWLDFSALGSAVTPPNKCDPATQTCGTGGVTPPFSASCAFANPGQPANGRTVSWIVPASSITGTIGTAPKFKYEWQVRAGSGAYQTVTTVTGSQLAYAFPASADSLPKYAQVKITELDSASQPVQSSNYISCPAGPTTGAGTGAILVTVKSSTTDTTVSDKNQNPSQISLCSNAGGANCSGSYPIGSPVTLRSDTSAKPSWSIATPSACHSVPGSSNEYNVVPDSPSVTCKVTANFDVAGGSIVVEGGNSPGNVVTINNPSYPAYSRSQSGAYLRFDPMSGGTTNITIDWSKGSPSLQESWRKAIASYGAGGDSARCQLPSICYRQKASGAAEQCVQADDALGTSVFQVSTNESYYFRFKFPKPCIPAGQQYSVFHRPGGYWTVPATADNGSSKEIWLQYNDTVNTPQ